jgi:uncharacterized protein YdcH (DUF465 family)
VTLETGLWLLGGVVGVVGVGVAFWQASAQHTGRLIDRTNGRVDALEARQLKCEERSAELKDELHREYPRRDALDALRTEIRADFEKVFDRLNQLAQQMSRYAGRADARDAREAER